MKDLFVMTRRERRGMIVVLVVVALMLIAAIVARSHRETVPTSVNVQEISEFDKLTDTIVVKETAPHKAKVKPDTTRKHQRRAPEKPRPARQPRPIDPLPQF